MKESDNLAASSLIGIRLKVAKGGWAMCGWGWRMAPMKGLTVVGFWKSKKFLQTLCIVSVYNYDYQCDYSFILFDYRFVCVCQSASIHISVCLSFCLSLCLFICLLINLCLSVYLFVCEYVCLFVCLPAYLSVCLSVCLSVSCAVKKKKKLKTKMTHEIKYKSTTIT